MTSKQNHDHQSEFIRRRQRDREKSQLTRKNLLGLVLVSLVLCAAFVVWVGIPEGGMALAELAGFAIVMLGLVIIIALAGAVVLALWRKKRRAQGRDSLSALLGEAENSDDAKAHDQKRADQ